MEYFIRKFDKLKSFDLKNGNIFPITLNFLLPFFLVVLK